MIGVELKYRKMRQRTDTYHPLVSLPTLLGTIGGSIGLGMGLSLLTVVEFFMFLVDGLRVVVLRSRITGMLRSHVTQEDQQTFV